jgi:hypothetical protein
VQSTKPIEERFQKRLNPVQAPVVLASAEPIGQVALLKEHRLSSPEVAVEKAGCSQGDGNDLGVDKCALGAFLMAPGSEPIIDQAVHSNDSGVHGRSVWEKVM